jgi:filamentous hemagglutinin family protein
MQIVYRHSLFRRLVAAVLMLDVAGSAMANPTGMTVHGGSATATSSGSQLTVTTTSQSAFLNWQSFNIAAGETTIFQEPSSTSIVWNQINNANPSQIYGSLQANGVVVLLNSSGFYFGPNSFVSAAGLVVSTANYSPPQNSSGGWEFNGPPPLASIVNYGQINIGHGGSAFLIADHVENHGTISAPGGSVGLAAGQTVLLSDRPDGRGMSMQVTLPSGSVDNEGRLIADGGTIAMNAKVVNQNGFIQANSVQNVNGTIELVASDQLTLGANSQIIASGDNSPAGSAGGNVTLQSGNNFSDSVGSQIITTGGEQGGNGGNVEISAPNIRSLNSSINARAQAGWTAGKLLLDPDYIILDTSGSGSAGSGTVLAGDNPGSTLDLNVNSAFANLAVSQIILQAVYDITLSGGTSWNLSQTIGANFGGVTSGQLTLEAGRNIIFGDGSSISDANNWSVTLQAGYDFVNQIVQSGIGNIYLNGGSGQSGSGSIQLSQAPINLTAGNSIVIGSGCQLIDDGGTIGLYAPTVNQNGLIQANSIGNQHGIIELVASDSLTLGAHSQIIANGDNSSSGSDGGNVTLLTDNNFSDESGSQISAVGGANGGNGGSVEISANNIQSLSSTIAINPSVQGGNGGNVAINASTIESLSLNVDASAQTGWSDGALSLNSVNMFGKASANVDNGQISLAASEDITFANGASWNLSAISGQTSGQLTLEAGGNITLAALSQITDANNWSVTLDAGYNFVNNSINYGKGSIFLQGGSGSSAGGSIQTAKGDITLNAGQDILLNNCFVRTTAGGNVSASALAGDVNTGTYAHGYIFNSANSINATYYKIDPINGVGGISTEAGGNVTITAGGDVTSYLPYGNSATTIGGDAGSGAFGLGPNQVGNVTIVAGGNVTGHYVEANGTGAIYAGVEMDASGKPVTDASGNYVLNSSFAGSAGTANNLLALSLITGGWTVNAAQDIYLQEVRNPNGVFNSFNSGGFTIKPTYHYFNYASGAYVNLAAGNSVNLGDSSSNLPRNDSSVDVPFIYAPILNIVAGAGGVTLNGDSDTYSKLILFPSPQGSLTITTTGGGSLTGKPAANADGSPSIFDLIVSDSGQSQYYDNNLDIFGLSDHAATPVHYDNVSTLNHYDYTTPIVLNISGNMNNVLLGAPEAAQITVGGDMINSRFQGMNLSSDPNLSIQVQVREIDGSLGAATVHPGLTSINVTGDILNRSDFTTITLPSGALVPDISLLAQAVAPSDVILALNLAHELFYDPNTGQLTFQGQVTDNVLNLLQNLTIQIYVNGQPQFNSDGSPVTQTVSIIDAATASALSAQYTSLGAIPTTANSGYILGGGGRFNITAHNMDLGTTLGIQSQGVSFDTFTTTDNNGNTVTHYPLAQYFTQGADINVNLSGNLDMFSTLIATLNGGNIYINAGGDINVGSPVFSQSTAAARGIFSTDQGNVDVYANGTIDVNGSRIAAYDTRQNTDNSSGTPGGSVTVVSKNGDINAGNGGSGFVYFSSFQVGPGPDYPVTTFSSTIPGSGIMEVSYTQPGNILVEAPNGTVNAGAGGILQLFLTGSPLPESTTLFDLPLNHTALANMFDLALNGKMQAALDLQKVLNGNPGNSAVDVFAGYELQKLDAYGNPIVDAYGNPVITALNLSDGTLVKISDNQDITATGSGVLGAGSVTLKASGNITGNIFALGNVNVTAANNIDVNVLGLGNVNVASAGGTVSGTIAGIESVSASGSSIDANLESNGSVSGNTSGESGLAPGTAADVASQGMASDNSASPAKNDDTTATDDDEKKKKGKVTLTQKTGRVTVVLPPKNVPGSKNQNPGTQTTGPRT